MLKIFPKRNLTISIEEINEEVNEIEIKEKKINEEISNFKLTYNTSQIKDQIEQRNILNSKNNSYLSELLYYMEGENYISDISYNYIINNMDISLISQSIFIINKNFQFNSWICNRNLESEFHLIKLITDTSNHKNLQIDILKSLKRKNNRYNDILPFSFNIVPYQNSNILLNKDNQNDWYINASFINGPFVGDEKCFIVAQAPIKETISKFYKMCFNHDINLIVMLCSFEEEGRKKCEYYLPKNINIETLYENDIKVTILSQENLFDNCIIKREIIINLNGIKKKLIHIQMLNWPDYSMPNKQNGYLTIHFLIDLISKNRKNYVNSPVVIHCSAGTGRSGTLIAIFNLVKCIMFFKKVNYDNHVKPFISVFNIVRKLREQRSGMVSCVEQYKFIYQFVYDWIKDIF